MRVTTANQYDTAVATLQKRAQTLLNSQTQLSSGKRIAVASDDPAGAARVERALAAIGRVEANQRALEASRNSMTLAEAAMGDASEILQQVRETLVAAGNGSYTDAERRGLAGKIASLREQLLAVANRPDGAGGYVFSGQGSSAPPFVDDAAGVRFNGVPGSQLTGTLEDFALSVDGRLTWEQARSGNGSFVTAPQANAITGQSPNTWIDAGRVTNPALLTGDAYTIQLSAAGGAPELLVTNQNTGATTGPLPYIPGKSVEFDGMVVTITGKFVDGDTFSVQPAANDLNVFKVLDDTVAALRTPNRSANQVQQANALALRDLDASFQGLQNVRSLVGERLNLLDGSETRLAGLKLYNQSERSAAEDLDLTEAVSRFKMQETGYDAALKSYAAVQRMSLFEYLNF